MLSAKAATPPLFHAKFGEVPVGLDHRRWDSDVITFEVTRPV